MYIYKVKQKNKKLNKNVIKGDSIFIPYTIPAKKSAVDAKKFLHEVTEHSQTGKSKGIRFFHSSGYLCNLHNCSRNDNQRFQLVEYMDRVEVNAREYKGYHKWYQGIIGMY